MYYLISSLFVNPDMQKGIERRYGRKKGRNRLLLSFVSYEFLADGSADGNIREGESCYTVEFI